MDELYIIPDRANYNFSILLAEKYNAHFMFRDFSDPKILDNSTMQNSIINGYLEIAGAPIWNTVHGTCCDMAVTSKDELIRSAADKRVHQVINIANLIGAYSVLFHTDFMSSCPYKSYKDAWLEQSTAYWKTILKKYPAVTVFIENLYETDPNPLAGLAENLKELSFFGLSFNYTRAAAVGADMEQWFEKLNPYIRLIQIHDTDGFSDVHLPVGDGKTNWAQFNELIIKYHYKGKLLLNVEGIENQKKSLKYMTVNKIYPFI